MNAGEIIEFLRQRAGEAAYWAKEEESLTLSAAADMLEAMQKDIEDIAHFRIDECGLCKFGAFYQDKCKGNGYDCETCKETGCRCRTCREMDGFEYKGLPDD